MSNPKPVPPKTGELNHDYWKCTVPLLDGSDDGEIENFVEKTYQDLNRAIEDEEPATRTSPGSILNECVERGEAVTVDKDNMDVVGDVAISTAQIPSDWQSTGSGGVRNWNGPALVAPLAALKISVPRRLTPASTRTIQVGLPARGPPKYETRPLWNSISRPVLRVAVFWQCYTYCIAINGDPDRNVPGAQAHRPGKPSGSEGGDHELTSDKIVATHGWISYDRSGPVRAVEGARARRLGGGSPNELRTAFDTALSSLVRRRSCQGANGEERLEKKGQDKYP
ncbi:hypothetical protein B0H11DRAFT_2189286 [Mycena galericulata]|nr:hypothetical protein B0H11DRAFT_2189286 [Mycena galericulata]